MNKEQAKYVLKKTMKDLSEELFCSSWNVNFEYELWKAVFIARDKNIVLDEETKNLLCRLYNKAGGWWTHQGKHVGLVFVSSDEWNKMLMTKEKGSKMHSMKVNESTAIKLFWEVYKSYPSKVFMENPNSFDALLLSASRKISRLEEENEELRTQSCINKIQKPKSPKKATLEQRVEVLEDLFDKWDEQLENMDGRIDANASCVNDLQGSTEHLEGEVVELQEYDFEKMKRDLENVCQRVDDMDVSVHDQKGGMHNLERSIEDLRDDVHTLQQTIGFLESDIEQLRTITFNLE